MFYHGTRHLFREFVTPAWFAQDRKVASVYATDEHGSWNSRSRIIEAELKLDNPLDLRSISLDEYFHGDELLALLNIDYPWPQWHRPAFKIPAFEIINDSGLTEHLRQKGYDGYLAREAMPSRPTEDVETFCVFHPSQVKIITSTLCKART